MTLTIRLPRLLVPGPRQQPAALAASLPAGSTFHAALTDSADDWVVLGSPRATPSVVREQTRQVPRPAPNPLGRAWTWLQSKYALTATRRLRVAETVSLGEKRFVALVCVEGREFLVGGGASGVSLLAQLGAAPNQASMSEVAGRAE
jgi:hypothetical protein